MPSPSINMPPELQAEVDGRRPSVVSRSQYVREALAVRFILEDEGRWDALVDEVNADDPLASPQE